MVPKILLKTVSAYCVVVCNEKYWFFQEKKKESEFTMPNKPVRGRTSQAAEKSETSGGGFKIYSDVSLKSEPTSSSLLEDTKMLLQVRDRP